MVRSTLFAAALVATLLTAFPASADPAAQAFVVQEHKALLELLKQPASAERQAKVTKQLQGTLNYGEMVRRAFGQPCNAAIPGCKNHWAELSEAQRAEVTQLLRRIVERTITKNIQKTVDFEITYRETKTEGDEARVRTEAKDKTKPREPAFQVDYVVKSSGSSRQVVDVINEGASVTKNYYEQFHKMLTTEGQGYPHLVKKLNEKLAKDEG
jgi:ABC-type transporter MlaC component